MNTDTIWGWLPTLTGWTLKSLVVFALCGLALLALRRASASARHLVCLLTLASLLALPILSLALPGWRLAMQLPGEPTPAHPPIKPQFATPPETGGGRVSDKRPLADAVLTSSSSRFGRTPVSEERGNKEVGSKEASSSTPTHPFPWTALLSAFWLLGFIAALLRPLLGLWGIASLSSTSRSASDDSTLAIAAECASALNLTPKPLLRQAEAPVPMTWGDRQPVILLPADAQAWPQDRLHAVLLHEMAHIRRRDWLSHRFADVVCALYWFHPLVWLTARRLRTESEIACDDLVLTSGIAAPDYARHLLAVARTLRPASAALPRTAIAMARTTRIEGRLKMILDSTHSRCAPSRRTLLLALGLSAATLVLLAIVRPAAKAQGVRITPALTAASLLSIAKPKALAPQHRPTHLSPKSVTVLGNISIDLPDGGSLAPLHLKASRVTTLSATNPVGRVNAVFPPDLSIDGTTFLAGVTDADKPGSPWWSANGALLPTPIYDTATHTAENHSGLDTNNVSFAFRLPPTAQDITLQYELPQSVRSSSDGFWPTKMQENARKTDAEVFAASGGVRVLTAAFPPSLKKTTLRVGIACGAWKTAASDSIGATLTGSAIMAGSIDIGKGAKFLFSPLSVTDNGVVVSVSTDAPEDLRVIAVTTQGQTVLPDQIGGNSIGTLDQITAHFGLPLAEIKEIRVQTRRFLWVEFKDVALHPVK